MGYIELAWGTWCRECIGCDRLDLKSFTGVYKCIAYKPNKQNDKDIVRYNIIKGDDRADMSEDG